MGFRSGCAILWDTLTGVDFLHSFRTQKTIRIYDRRLVLINLVFLALTFGYVLWNILDSRGYLLTVQPVGWTSHWVSTIGVSAMTLDASGLCTGTCEAVDNFTAAVSRIRRWYDAAKRGTQQYGYCDNSDYDFDYSAEWAYGNLSCAFLPASEIWSKSDDSLFITTASVQTEERSFIPKYSNASTSGCLSEFARIGVSCPHAVFNDDFGRCSCMETSQSFLVGAEHLTIEFDRGFTSSYASNDDSSSGSSPRTIVRLIGCEGDSCDLFDFPKNQIARIPLNTLLSRLHIALDGNACDQNGGQSTNRVNGICPRARLTGLSIDMQMSFYNWNQHGNGMFAYDTPDPICIIELTPTIKWTSKGNEISYREPPWVSAEGIYGGRVTTNRYSYGVKFAFRSGTGKISRFNIFRLVGSVLEGVVLMVVAKHITTMIAKHALGPTSAAYNATIDERFSFSRELARFCCQALVAQMAFHSIDQNHSGSINEPELLAHVKEVLKPELAQCEIAECNAAVFEMCSSRSRGGKSKPQMSTTLERKGTWHQSQSRAKEAWAGAKKKKESGIDLIDFVDSVTEDKVSFSVIKEFLKGKIRYNGEMEQIRELSSKGSSCNALTDCGSTTDTGIAVCREPPTDVPRVLEIRGEECDHAQDSSNPTRTGDEVTEAQLN